MIHRMDPIRADFEPLPSRLRPMLATAGPLPARDEGWAYEIKWDGVRAISYVEGGRVRMMSRNDKDLTHSFPEFREIGEFLGARPCVLDGEIVVLGARGTPDFSRLQHRLHLAGAGAIAKQLSNAPASYVVFDLLHLNGHSLTSHSYDERRSQLEDLHLSGSSFTTADSFRDARGQDILEATREAGLEGVVAKLRSSPYVPGKRSEAWIKTKNIQTQEVVIGGWTEGAGNRQGSIGALLVGIPSAEGLRYVGKVGTGFSVNDRENLLSLLRPKARKTSPFVPAPDVTEGVPHFVRPVYVGEVRFGEWTESGRLRHPTWRGLRPDKDPKNVIGES
jgi:bifunctional non-homologous end joining protein LigD